MALFPISAESQAYVDGYKNGRADRALGISLSVSMYVESSPGYSQSYAMGYRDGISGSWWGQQCFAREQGVV
jgi:hypothetical protein